MRTNDYQRIKLTELDDINSSDGNATESSTRIPRTIEVEVRDTLVNTCIAGDILNVVGIVKAVQVKEKMSLNIRISKNM